MRIALCQIVSGTNKQENLNQITELTEQAAATGAQLAVFPEFAMYDAADLGPDVVAEAESLDGPFVTALTELSKRTGVAILAGMMESVAGEGRAYNTLIAVSPEEGLSAFYHKQHLYDAFGFKESDFICPGPLGSPVSFVVDDIKVGILTCYDLRFPEVARLHADAGVDLLIYPAAWVPGPRKEDHWNTLARARAIENTIYVAAVTQGPPIGTGGTLVSDPMGVTLAEIGERTGIVIADIDPGRIAQVRGVNPSLANRRYRIATA